MLTRFIKTEERLDRYRATPCGRHLDDYITHLSALEFKPSTTYTHLKDITAFGEYLVVRGIETLSTVDETVLEDFVRWYLSTSRRSGPQRQSDKSVAEHLRGALRGFFAYLRSTGTMRPCEVFREATPYDAVLDEYLSFLREHRGFAQPTIDQHQRWARAFLSHLGRSTPQVSLAQLTTGDVEEVADAISSTLSVYDHQRLMSAIDALLRYLKSSGCISDACTPFLPRRRKYALATLPSTIPWADVERAIDGMDRGTPMGRRDYALLRLVAMYGLRSREVVELRLEDFDWRHGALRVRQTKTRRTLELPLLDCVVDAVLDYLQRGRPQTRLRQVFLKCQAPAGPITRAVLYEVVRKALMRAGIEAAQYGPHILRHARATALVREGHSLKTVGDLLGHQVPEATAVYCKLATDDLRAVALQLPEQNS